MKLRRKLALYGFLASLAAAAGLAPMAGCGDDGDGDARTAQTSTTSAGAGGESGGFHLKGTLSYEYVPYDIDFDGLDYSATVVRPIRGVSVHLLDAATDMEIAKAVSDDDGGYAFDYDGAARVKLWIYSETDAPVITIEDNTSNNEVYVVESAEVDSGKDARLDVLAASGWDGMAYIGARASAPFAVLDAAYTAAQRFMKEATPAPTFPPLKINWSENNRPSDGKLEDGEIGTSFWNDEDSELYILGKADVDTDEFDSHVIVHEWGHYFESKISRSDNIGGNHTYGDILDPRVAMSEGFCNALSAIILDPDSIYTDSSGMGQADGYIDDLDANDISSDASPGWFSEYTVEALVYDLYDNSADEPFDKVSLGLNSIYGVMISGYKKTPALTSLFAFVSALKKANPGQASAIDDLVAYNTIDADFGIDPIQDEWATGETHGGGVKPALPLYIDAVIGGSYTADLIGGKEYNALEQNRAFRFVGDGKPVTITTTCPTDIDIYVYHIGEIVASDESPDGDESVTFDTVMGETYVLSVGGYDSKAAPYSAMIEITH